MHDHTISEVSLTRNHAGTGYSTVMATKLDHVGKSKLVGGFTLCMVVGSHAANCSAGSNL